MVRPRYALAGALALALAWPTPAVAQQQPQQPPAAAPVALTAPTRHPEHFTLPNGLEVVLEEDHRSPRVAVVVKYRVGQADDPLGYSGLAHLVEHLMYSGFRVPDTQRDFIGELEASGSADFNGVTSADYTTYFEVVPAERLEPTLWMESGRMAYLLAQLDQAVLDRQRRVVQDEDREHAEAVDSGVLSRAVADALFPEGHPYHRLPVDGMSQVEAATLPAVQWFFQSHYGPENAVLVLVGDFRAQDARALTERYFGPVARGAGPAPTPAGISASPPAAQAAIVTVALPTRLEVLQAHWRTPPYFAPGDAELDLLAYVLAGRDAGRLDRALVRPGEAAVARASQQSHRRGSDFEVELVAAPTHRASTLLHGLDDVVNTLRRQPVSAAELAAAQRHWQLRLFTRGESLLDRANQLADYVVYTGDADYLARDLARYASATPDSVLQTARTYLDPSQRVVGLLTRDRAAPRDGRLVSVVRGPGGGQ